MQRRIVFDYLLASESHPSVDTIYSDLLPANPGLSRTTVYNTLELLQKHGLVKVLDFGEGFLRYDGKITPHCHFRCEKCGAIYDIAKVPEGCENLRPECGSCGIKDCAMRGQLMTERKEDNHGNL